MFSDMLADMSKGLYPDYKYIYIYDINIMFIVLARQEAQNISRDPDPADGEKLSLQWSKM